MPVNHRVSDLSLPQKNHSHNENYAVTRTAITDTIEISSTTERLEHLERLLLVGEGSLRCAAFRLSYLALSSSPGETVFVYVNGPKISSSRITIARSVPPYRGTMIFKSIGRVTLYAFIVRTYRARPNRPERLLGLVKEVGSKGARVLQRHEGTLGDCQPSQ
jgi:hypothetical protein